jgi:hypothetical protein
MYDRDDAGTCDADHASRLVHRMNELDQVPADLTSRAVPGPGRAARPGRIVHSTQARAAFVHPTPRRPDADIGAAADAAPASRRPGRISCQPIARTDAERGNAANPGFRRVSEREWARPDRVGRYRRPVGVAQSAPPSRCRVFRRSRANPGEAPTTAPLTGTWQLRGIVVHAIVADAMITLRTPA